ncbi:MAG: hypothetical protein AB7L28_16205, partial [Kofleriaceae bacterium]
MAKAPVVAGAVLLVVGGAGLGYALTRKPTTSGSDAANAATTAAIAELDEMVKSMRSAVEQHATELATEGKVRVCAGSDARTCLDAYRQGDIKLNVEAGEAIVVGQVRKPGQVQAGKPIALLVVPENQPAPR